MTLSQKNENILNTLSLLNIRSLAHLNLLPTLTLAYSQARSAYTKLVLP